MAPTFQSHFHCLQVAQTFQSHLHCLQVAPIFQSHLHCLQLAPTLSKIKGSCCLTGSCSYLLLELALHFLDLEGAARLPDDVIKRRRRVCDAERSRVSGADGRRRGMTKQRRRWREWTRSGGSPRGRRRRNRSMATLQLHHFPTQRLNLKSAR